MLHFCSWREHSFFHPRVEGGDSVRSFVSSEGGGLRLLFLGVGE